MVVGEENFVCHDEMVGSSDNSLIGVVVMVGGLALFHRGL